MAAAGAHVRATGALAPGGLLRRDLGTVVVIGHLRGLSLLQRGRTDRRLLHLGVGLSPRIIHRDLALLQVEVFGGRLAPLLLLLGRYVVFLHVIQHGVDSR